MKILKIIWDYYVFNYPDIFLIITIVVQHV